MATSGTRTFTLDVAEAIEEAYELLGLELRTGYDARKARRSLNIMFQDWSNRGINLWTVEAENISLVAGTASYEFAAYDVDILEAAIRRGGTDYLLERISREDYLNIPNKTQVGRPTQLYVDRSVPLKAVLWPVPENSTDILVTYKIQQIQDAAGLGGSIDVPTRFIPAMVAGLAYYLSYKVAPERTTAMEAAYERTFARAANEDSERGSWHIRPER